jgi:hypothetical protein
MTEEIKLQKIEYYRPIRLPTLSQYVYRRGVKEAMSAVKGNTGVTTHPGTGRPVPKSALAAREVLKGLSAEQLLKEHPEWREDYEKDILAKRK